MRILSWNVNGLRPCIKRGDFDQIKETLDLDVICLQETRTHEKLIALDNYHHYWFPSEDKGRSGTLTMTLVEPVDFFFGIGLEGLKEEGRVITVDMGSVYIVNTYFPNTEGGQERIDYRWEWDKAYRRFITQLSYDKPVIACGDVNVTMSRKDIYAENSRMDQMERERAFITDAQSSMYALQEYGFIDAYRYLYPDETGEWTWWSNRLKKREQNRGWRLDYFLVDKAIQDNILNVEHLHDITGSDHCPILLDCSIEDTEYARRYEEAAALKRSKEAEYSKLSAMWSARKARFKDYAEKLSELQAEIALHSQRHEPDRVKELQYRILEDIRFKCLAVNKVSAVSAPPGPDGIKWRTNADKMKAARDELDWRIYKAGQRRLVEIMVKPTGKIRRPEILNYKDKAMSILIAYTFQPIVEVHADRRSFSSRKGRSRQSAIVEIANLFMDDDAPDCFLYLDVKAFYSKLHHKWLMQHIPVEKGVLRELLDAGHIFDGELFPPEGTGISEGSPLSPLIANFSLDGIQRAIYKGLNGDNEVTDYKNGCMVRYADDMVIALRSSDEVEKAKEAARNFLKQRGLDISFEKSEFGVIYAGLTVLGCTIRKEYRNVAITPSTASVERFCGAMRDFIINSHLSQRDMIERINKKLMGWSAQYHAQKRMSILISALISREAKKDQDSGRLIFKM